MKRFILCTLVAASLPAIGAEKVYTPTIQPGQNPAATAAPRDDWYATVQGKFDKYSGKPFDIVFEGDSITNRWEGTGRDMWAKHFAGKAADFGIEGDRTENVLWRLSKGQMDGMDPKAVVIMIGTNNTGRDSADQIAQGIENIVKAYEEKCPHAQILLMSVFPRGEKPTDGGRQKVMAINEKISKLDGGRVTYIDVFDKFLQPDQTISRDMMPDFVHPTAKGYEIWTDAILPEIQKYTKAN